MGKYFGFNLKSIYAYFGVSQNKHSSVNYSVLFFNWWWWWWWWRGGGVMLGNAWGQGNRNGSMQMGVPKSLINN